MAHLPPDEIAALNRVLTESGQFGDDWLDAVLAALPSRYRNGLPAAAAPGPRLELALSQLNEDGPLADDGRLPIVLVLKRLEIDPLQAVVDIARRLRMLIDSPAAGAEPAVTLQQALSDHRIVGSALFADREGLRKRIAELMQPEGPPAVVVNAANGESRVGKSHTRMLLAHAARRTRAFLFAWVEIKPEQASSFTPDWLVEELVRSAVPGVGPAPERRDPPARWHGELSDWAFTQLMRAAAGPVLILVDGLGLSDVKPEVRSVVSHLAMRAGTPTGGRRLCLVLIHCDPTEIQRAGCVAHEERFGHLTAVDAKACLERLAPDRAGELWARLEPLLSGAQGLTTPLVGELMQEVLRA
jgi:hypothetical protein